LSGDAVSAIDLDRVNGKVILLYPQCETEELRQSTHIIQILFPEVDPLKYRYIWQSQQFWAKKIQLIPYNLPFKATWPDYIIDI